MKRQIMLLSACTVALLSACSSNTRIANEVYAPAAKNELRAPATPLVTIDPYTSAWSFAKKACATGPAVTSRYWEACV